MAINLRFPTEEMHKAMKEIAKKNHRSLNNEIIQAIEYYLKNAPEARREVVKKPSPK